MAADEDAIRQVPAGAWAPGLTQDGDAEEDKEVTEITGLMTRAGNWPDGLRWIARRVRPSRRHLRNLTDYEKATGWKYSITCTNVPDDGIPCLFWPSCLRGWARCGVVVADSTCGQMPGVITARRAAAHRSRPGGGKRRARPRPEITGPPRNTL